uniref:Uncharacterized protein n=1 Tax=Anguilla anguilla TaxID=7936 RepID=A0A0E9W1T0_ANGAN
MSVDFPPEQQREAAAFSLGLSGECFSASPLAGHRLSA